MDNFFLDKQDKSGVWLVVNTMLVMVSAQYCFQLPEALFYQYGAHFDIDNFEVVFASIYAIYFLANSILPFLAGCVRDILGDRFMMLFLNCAIVLGQCIVTFGIAEKSLLIFTIGRVVLGCGVEAILMTLTAFITPYYKYTYITLAIGLYQMFTMFGTVICMWYAPGFQNVVLANWVGIILAVLGLCTNLMAVYQDQKIEQECLEHPIYFSKEDLFNNQGLQARNSSKIIKMEEQENQIQVQEERKSVEPVRIVSEPVPRGCLDGILHYGDIKQYPKIYWLMAIFYVFISVSILALVNVAVEFLTRKWLADLDNGEILASKMVTIMWLFSGIVTPFFGIVIDFFGHRSTMTQLSAFMCVFAHFLVILYQPFEGLLLLGFSFALSFTTIWSGIIYIILPDNYGKSFGILICLQNLGLSIIPSLTNFLRRSTSTVILAETFLAILAIVALILTIFIYKEDHFTGAKIDRGLHVDKETITDRSSQIEQNKALQKKDSDIQHVV